MDAEYREGPEATKTVTDDGVCSICLLDPHSPGCVIELVEKYVHRLDDWRVEGAAQPSGEPPAWAKAAASRLFNERLFASDNFTATVEFAARIIAESYRGAAQLGQKEAFMPAHKFLQIYADKKNAAVAEYLIKTIGPMAFDFAEAYARAALDHKEKA
jgi:hypothetical protein